MKDHFIPCLLMARFSVDGGTGRKALVYQFKNTGPHPGRPVPAKDLAYAGDFYHHDEFPNLDAAGLRARELEAAELIRELIAGLDPQQRSEQVSRLFRTQSVRTQTFRTEVGSRVSSAVEAIFERFPTQKGVSFMRRMLEQLSARAGSTRDLLLELGISPALSDLLVSHLGEQGVLDLIRSGLTIENLEDTVSQARQSLEQGEVIPGSIQKAQVKGLHSLVSESQGLDGHALAHARWVRLDTPKDTPLILGDCCVVACDDSGTLGWSFRFGAQWREMYLPVGKELAIVALAPGGPSSPTLNAESLNRASAALARDTIYASRCTAYERELATLIGTMEPLLGSQEIDSIIVNVLERDSPSA